MLQRFIMVVCVLFLVFAGVGIASATYLTVTDCTPGWVQMGLNPGGALGVNATGQATGAGYNPSNAVDSFFWNGSTVTALGKGPFSSQTRGMGINNAGTVVGYGLTPASGWYKTTSGAITLLPSLSGGSSDYAFAINTAGEIGGYSNGPGHNSATIWNNSTGSYVPYDLHTTGGVLYATGNSRVLAVNDSGRACGANNYGIGINPPSDHAFYSDYSIVGGALTCTNVDLYALFGATVASALNNSNQIVGWRPVSVKTRAFLYTVGGGNSLLPLLGAGLSNAAQGIRDDGTVVGWSTTDAGDTIRHAFIWDSVNGMRDLNDLIDPTSGWVLTEAWAIRGDYVSGRGTYGGTTHGFVIQLPPVPEPSTLLLMASGLVGLLAYAWRKRK